MLPIDQNIDHVHGLRTGIFDNHQVAFFVGTVGIPVDTPGGIRGFSDEVATAYQNFLDQISYRNAASSHTGLNCHDLPPLNRPSESMPPYQVMLSTLANCLDCTKNCQELNRLNAEMGVSLETQKLTQDFCNPQ
jgi:hypothetical protein